MMTTAGGAGEYVSSHMILNQSDLPFDSTKYAKEACVARYSRHFSLFRFTLA